MVLLQMGCKTWIQAVNLYFYSSSYSSRFNAVAFWSSLCLNMNWLFRGLKSTFNCFLFQFLFTKGPLTTSKETGPTQHVICSYELASDSFQKMARELKDEWTSMCHLYSIVRQFADLYTGMHRCNSCYNHHILLSLAYHTCVVVF